jgi:hypothetical protein
MVRGGGKHSGSHWSYRDILQDFEVLAARGGSVVRSVDGLIFECCG